MSDDTGSEADAGDAADSGNATDPGSTADSGSAADSAKRSDPIRRSVTVYAPPERAFEVFTDEMERWWPAQYTWSGEALEAIGIEGGEGGFCFERGPHGYRLDWGRVLVWEPPRRLVFSWQIGPDRVPVPDPERASEVEVRFVAAEAPESSSVSPEAEAAAGSEGPQKETSDVEEQASVSGDAGTATRIELEHRGFDRHGDDGDGYRLAMGSEYGWPMILAGYAEAVGADDGER